MSKLDLLKFMEQYEGEVEIADFTPDELEELLSEMREQDRPLTKEKFRKKYFEYYDDVKVDGGGIRKKDW